MAWPLHCYLQTLQNGFVWQKKYSIFIVLKLTGKLLLLLLLLHPLNGLFSRTTWVSRYQKGKYSLNLNEARDGGVFGRQWHQLDHLHIAPDNYSNTPSLNFSGRVIFLTPNHVKALKGMSKHDRLTENIYSYNHSRAAMPKGFANRFLRNPSDLAHCDCLLITCQRQN